MDMIAMVDLTWVGAVDETMIMTCFMHHQHASVVGLLTLVDVGRDCVVIVLSLCRVVWCHLPCRFSTDGSQLSWCYPMMIHMGHGYYLTFTTAMNWPQTQTFPAKVFALPRHAARLSRHGDFGRQVSTTSIPPHRPRCLTRVSSFSNKADTSSAIGTIGTISNHQHHQCGCLWPHASCRHS